MSTTPSIWRSLSALALALLTLAPAAFADDFPALYNSEKEAPAPVSPEEALRLLQLPPGFHASMYAHEPDVQNPIGMTFDPRGRMWVAENYTYAERQLRFDMKLRDRVIILEDKDGDGKAETRKVFTDKVQMLTSVEVGRGGVWLMCPPQLLFIPDANGDDVPDSEPQVVLDGFTVPQENYHNWANGLRWGPDGWLYGRCGASAPGELGAPGTPAEHRVPMRGTMWRYHPTRKVVEVLSHGTTNPWGHDWDQHGELFFVNTVNGHLWHGLTGAHFVRPHTLDPNPHAYVALDMIADHWHFDTGKGWQASRDGKANDLGGGHAHCGAMIYQGDEWPEQYRHKLFTINMHGRRCNVERLERQGSGYVGCHEPDVFFFGDPWFRGIDIQQGPGGAAYVLDWSDTGECHDHTGVHRTSGRIYKIWYGEKKAEPAEDFTAMNSERLQEALGSPDVYRARQAQARLIKRELNHPHLSSREKPMVTTIHSNVHQTSVQRWVDDEVAGLWNSGMNSGNEVLRVRSLMSASAVGEVQPALLQGALRDKSEHVRATALRLATENLPLDTITSMAATTSQVEEARLRLQETLLPLSKDPSSLVRATLASTLQRLAPAQRLHFATELVQQVDDAHDRNLPALVWYGLMPLGDSHPEDLAKVAAVSTWPDLTKWITRRLAVGSEKSKAPLETLIEDAKSKKPEIQLAVLQGLSEGYRGWRKAPKPQAWDTFSTSLATNADEPTKAMLRDLSTLFGDGRALDEVKQLALDDKAEMPVRIAALKTLIEANPPELRGICEKLLEVRFLNTTAARGLATFDDPKVGDLILQKLARFHPSERPAVIDVLVQRVPWSMAMLEQVNKGRVRREEITAFHARQMRNLGDTALNEKLTATWGEMREGSADKQAQIAQLRPQLTAELMKTAHANKGRQTFSQICAACHTLYGEGGKIGPDLTGSNRQNLDYLLDNIVDPSAVVTADFRVTLLTMKDGRVLSGMTTTGNDKTVTLRTPTENLTLDRGDITKTEVLPASMMPEGLLQTLTPEQVRDLFAYLMSTSQVPLPKE
jgi:putative membrane-bound dehydrogenase-like protein